MNEWVNEWVMNEWVNEWGNFTQSFANSLTHSLYFESQICFKIDGIAIVLGVEWVKKYPDSNYSNQATYSIN